MNIGERIRLLRNKKGFTLKDISEKTNLSISFISDIENGRRTPRLENLQYIADALNVSIDRLTGEAASSIIEEQLKELGMTQAELAEKTQIPLAFFQNLDNIVPGQEVDGGEQCYKNMFSIAWILNLAPSRLMAALARQEIPSNEWPDAVITPEEAFGPLANEAQISYNPDVLPNVEELTEDEMNFIIRFRVLPPAGQQMMMTTLENIEKMLRENSATKETEVIKIVK
jgi:transcriptional regulator with XRE-family HTH domain